MACLSLHYRTLVLAMEVLYGCSVIVLVLVNDIASTVIQDIFKKVKVRSLTECALR